MKKVFTRFKKISYCLVATLLLLVVQQAQGQTYFSMASGNYSETFTAWSGFSTNWNGTAISGTGATPSPTRITTASTGTMAVVSTGSAIGYDATTSTKLVFLSTGATDNQTAIACDLNLNFSGRNAGTISFDVAQITNGTGNRVETLKLYYSVDGTSWTEITGTNLPFAATNGTASSGSVSVSLPSAINGQSTVKLRFYAFNGVGGTTGNRARISIDNVAVTSVCPTISATFTGATAICNGGSTNLSATVTGGISPYTLTLDNSGGSASTSSPVSKSVSPSTTTAYTATVADSKGCAATVTGNTQTVTVNNPPSASVLANGTGATTICSGQSANIKVDITGGASPYTVVTSAGTTNSYTSGSNISVSPSSTTTYTLTSVTDNNGCVSTGLSGTAPVTVTNTWTAQASGNWSNTGTWTCGSVPTATANIDVPVGTALTVDGTRACNNLTLSGGSVGLSGDLTVNGLLTLTNGKITLGANNLTVGSTSGASASSYVVTDGTGALTIPCGAGATTVLPVGSSTTSYDIASFKPTNAVNVTVKVKGSITNPVATPSLAVPREWDLSPSATPGATELKFTPDAAALTGSNTPTGAEGFVGHWNGSSYDANITAVYVGGAWAVASYTGSFSPFIVAAPGVALSVDYTKFSVTPNSTTNVLSWATSNEKDNLQFNIERSADGQTFTTIGTVKGKNTAASYNFTDNTPLSISHYRLAQQDYNGTITYSKVVTVVRTGKAGSLKVYPSTTNEVVNLETVTTEGATLQIFDATGRVVWSKTLAADGLNTTQVPVANFARGLYIVVFETKGARTMERFVKD